jgi:hypothetical protein
VWSCWQGWQDPPENAPPDQPILPSERVRGS